MLAQMPMDVLLSWQHFLRNDPGEVRADKRMARLAATILNVNRGRGQSAIDEQRLMLYRDEPRNDNFHQEWATYKDRMKAGKVAR